MFNIWIIASLNVKYIVKKDTCMNNKDIPFCSKDDTELEFIIACSCHVYLDKLVDI